MTLPNLKNPTTITGKTARYAVTASLATALAAPGTGKTFKINSIFCSNNDTANAGTAVDISLSIYDGSTDRYIAYTISVPADATQIISNKDTYFYLEEIDSLRAVASITSRLQLVIGYEEIS